MALFRRGMSPHQTALAMIGVQAGDRLFLVGRPDPSLAAELARITGLNGQTLVATTPSSRPPLDAAAAQAGVLMEVIETTDTFVPPSEADGSHDAVVIQMNLTELNESELDTLAADAVGAIRPGGRIIIVDGRRRTGVFAARIKTLPADAVLTTLTRAGTVGSRLLGEEDGVTYYEGRKSR